MQISIASVLQAVSFAWVVDHDGPLANLELRSIEDHVGARFMAAIVFDLGRTFAARLR